jgi:hypothetical protein
VGNPYCFTHNKLLQEFPLGSRISLNQALVAFEYYSRRGSRCEDKGVYGVLSQEKMISLGGRAVNFLSLIELNLKLGEVHMEMRWRACKCIIQIILYPLYGVINTIWSKKRMVPRVNNLYQALELGALCANTEDRAIALLLFGMVFGLFSSDEQSFMIRQLSGVEFIDIRFDDSESFGRCSNIFVGVHSKSMIDSVTRFSAVLENPSFSQFSTGFCRQGS